MPSINKLTVSDLRDIAEGAEGENVTFALSDGRYLEVMDVGDAPGGLAFVLSPVVVSTCVGCGTRYRREADNPLDDEHECAACRSYAFDNRLDAGA